MRGGAKPEIRRSTPVTCLTTQGDHSDELFLLLDGVLAVEVDDRSWAEVGPGAVLGERAILEGGTPDVDPAGGHAGRVAVATSAQIDRAKLAALSAGHRREEQAASD